MDEYEDVAVQASSSEWGVKGSFFYSDCLECGELITNPLCPNCIFEGFKQWISPYADIYLSVVVEAGRYLESCKSFDNSIVCVACGSSSTHLCPYCFTNYLAELLKDMKVSEDMLREFHEIFNFDFGNFDGHWGYREEAEKLGAL